MNYTQRTGNLWSIRNNPSCQDVLYRTGTYHVLVLQNNTMFVYPKLGYEMNVFVLLLACFNDGKIGQVHNEVPTEVEDIDGDGFTGLSDCDETSAANHVGAIEICDGIDNNCDGAVDENVTSTYYGDADADG